jgi:hemolysin III
MVRTYSAREEIAHSATSALGVVGSFVGIAWVAMSAAVRGDPWRLVGGIAFGFTALLLFGTSTFYHAARAPRSKEVLQKLDHSAIYLLIAGTYTVFTIGVMRGAFAWTLFGIVWLLAASGIAAEFLGRVRKPVRSALLYLAMGWLGIVAVKQLVVSLTPWQLAWLLAGGIAYSCGVPFYVWKSRPYTHTVWHLFVLAGVACHFVAVLSVVSSPPAP